MVELRTKYLIKGSATIVRSLLAPGPDRALEALRQLPQCGSVFGDLMRNHVALMRARGFRYDTNTTAGDHGFGSTAAIRRARNSIIDGLGNEQR